MAKVYPVPELSIAIKKRIEAAGMELMRKSKECIKLVPIDAYATPGAPSYARYYTFHLDFINKVITGFNLNEYTSTYKRVTIWLKREELQLILDIEAELAELIAEDLIKP